ncbi:MAG: hypothetical protein ACJAT3_000334 [Akkermansiaceae bacterium]|jgi:hypothetical protein|tara:strand:- start:6909 stop:7025 length:117 start_codon:yes stop_codon:yes gene_type:complete
MLFSPAWKARRHPFSDYEIISPSSYFFASSACFFDLAE